MFQITCPFGCKKQITVRPKQKTCCLDNLYDHLETDDCRSGEFGYIRRVTDETKLKRKINRAKRHHESPKKESLTIEADKEVLEALKLIAMQPKEKILEIADSLRKVKLEAGEN